MGQILVTGTALIAIGLAALFLTGSLVWWMIGMGDHVIAFALPKAP